MKQIFATIILTIIGLYGFAQPTASKNGKITGTILDGNSKTIEAATIALLRAKDSSTIKFTAAGRDGSFSFENIAEGKYLVSVTAVGHQKGFSKPVEISGADVTVNLPAINLVPVSKSVAGVTVTAKRPLIEQKIDRTILNVEASVTNVGATALEVLEKAPGVTVDKDGNISLKGKEGVMVMIDGRPTQLGGADLANLLRNMSSNQLDQVEIMTNPPARFDAAGNAGVINIKTKKNKAAGYNGSVSLGYSQGIYPKSNEGLNFNYRDGKVNLFTNLSHNFREHSNTLTIQRKLFNNNTNAVENYFDQTAKMFNHNNSLNGKLGLDYFLNKKTTLGVVVNSFRNSGDFTNRNRTLISSPAKDLESETKATVATGSVWKNFSTNFNFRTVLDSAGSELTSDLDYITYNSNNDMMMVNSYFDGFGNSMKKSDSLAGSLPQNINIYSGRVDYYHPMKKGAKFEAGIKSSIVKTDNNAAYDSIQYGRVIRDLGRSNHFVYEENINAAYANLSTPLSKKISAQLGLRLENTNAKGDQLTTGQNFDRSYTQLFPTAFFQYKIDEKNNLGLNYGRRIRRPNYQSLNPFIKFLDRYTYEQGNPDLKPQLSDNIELSHTFRNVLTTTVNYSATNDIIQMVLEQKGQEAYAKQANIAKLRQVGIAFNTNIPMNKWWTNNLFVNIFRNKYEGVVNNENISFSATSLALNGSQQFKVSKTLTAELSGFYRTAGLEGVLTLRSMGMLNVGISQQMLKNNGTVRLTIRDVLFSQKMDASSKYGNVDAKFQEVRDSRIVNLGFTYRFSKGKVNGVKKRTNGSAGDEQNRVGVGQ